MKRKRKMNGNSMVRHCRVNTAVFTTPCIALRAPKCNHHPPAQAVAGAAIVTPFPTPFGRGLRHTNKPFEAKREQPQNDDVGRRH